MKKYQVVCDEKMYEDELPEDLPKIMYDWWYELSSVVDGVRMGPKLTEKGN